MLYSTQQIEGLWKIGDISLIASRAPENPDEYLKDETEAGTNGYRSPELILYHQFNAKVDVWAMGCILYALVYSKSLFANDFEVSEYAKKQREGNVEGEVVNLNPYLTSFESAMAKWNVKMLILNMFQECPKDRPWVKELIEGAFQKLVDCRASGQRLRVRT